MHTLLVAATPLESQLIQKELQMKPLADSDIDLWQSDVGPYYLLHSGIGMSNMAYALGYFQATYQVKQAINFGIAGSFDRSIALAEVVEVVSDCFAELGADSPQGPIWLEEMGFPLMKRANQAFYNELYNPKPSKSVYPKVSALTVNRVTGTETGLAERLAEWPRQLESMEGAAFFQAFLRSGTPFLAFRGISNYVEVRNKKNWQIGPAVQNVQKAILALLPDLQ
ncbi:MAG: futalosine hydrolase [Bacteroidia bacterium]